MKKPTDLQANPVSQHSSANDDKYSLNVVKQPYKDAEIIDIIQ